jgi:hypothetical protein
MAKVGNYDYDYDTEALFAQIDGDSLERSMKGLNNEQKIKNMKAFANTYRRRAGNSKKAYNNYNNAKNQSNRYSSMSGGPVEAPQSFMNRLFGPKTAKFYPNTKSSRNAAYRKTLRNNRLYNTTYVKNSTKSPLHYALRADNAYKRHKEMQNSYKFKQNAEKQ